MTSLVSSRVRGASRPSTISSIISSHQPSRGINHLSRLLHYISQQHSHSAGTNGDLPNHPSTLKQLLRTRVSSAFVSRSHTLSLSLSLSLSYPLVPFLPSSGYKHDVSTPLPLPPPSSQPSSSSLPSPAYTHADTFSLFFLSSYTR